MKKNILITGATGGIGLAIAKEMGLLGYHILINGIDRKQGAVAEEELSKLNISHKIYYFDVTNEEAVNNGFVEIAHDVSSLHAIVNGAGGLGGRSDFESMTTDFYRRVMALNLDSVFFVSRAGIPLLKLDKDSSIVNFTSIAAWNAGGPGAGIYGTAKAGVLTLTRALAKDLVKYGIRVNAVSPGTIDTPFHQATKDTNPALFESWKNDILMKRFGDASEVATVVKFLIGPDASYLTGEVIQINGGQDFL
ncbi:SDR family NAD(P)-dependent oxidoreductase [Lapidilactobacillus bayanensis]|uniref:SDR family NAD(P)-dependent oxidoreductase n=1 Tax=Lapidilactobacillus bayanensis TaxID=2485998 RepID=UPI000F7B5558|nr:SDR family NAD(P)-dependent oxidoreductase [Lapidilactobacillus bayanensis]